MSQPPLWYDSLADALRAGVEDPRTGGPKVCGVKLFGEAIGPTEAGKKLMRALNPEHAQNLSLEQVDALLGHLSRAGVHVAMDYQTRAYGYRDTEPMTPEGERQRLQRELLEGQRELLRRMDRLERMGLLSVPRDPDAADSLATLAGARR